MKIENLNRKLLEACEKGDLRKVESLISRGANIDWTEEHVDKKNLPNERDGQTALMLAASHGHKEICQLLIASGAKINICDKYTESALVKAGVEGHKGICELLIKNGAEIDSRLLSASAQEGHMDICKLLIDNGVDVNYVWQDNGKVTALILASQEGRRDICELLIDNGAGVNMRDDQGQSALTKAILKGHKEVCELLIQKGATFNANELLLAKKPNREEIFDLLMQYLSPMIKNSMREIAKMHETADAKDNGTSQKDDNPSENE